MSPILTSLLRGMGGLPVAESADGIAARLQDLVSLASVLVCPVLLAVVCYGVACWIWPLRNCHACGGTGQRRSPTGRAFRGCRACNGTGGQLRFGRRVYERLAAHRRGIR